MLKITVNLKNDFADLLTNKLESEDVSMEKYIKTLIEKDLTPTIQLENGFSYNSISRKLLDSNNDVVKLTSIQKNIIVLLMEKRNTIIPIEIIKEVCWGRDDVSIHSVRNMVKKIRAKTYCTFITNHPCDGYEMTIK